MKKRKVKTGRLLFDEKELLQVLYQQLREGYILYEFDTFHLCFKQTENTNIKYSVAYKVKKSDIDQGYVIQAAHENVFILTSSYIAEPIDINQEDKEDVLSKLYKPKASRILLALGILFLSLYMFIPENIAELVYHNQSKLACLLLFFGALAYLLARGYDYFVYQDKNPTILCVLNRIILALFLITLSLQLGLYLLTLIIGTKIMGVVIVAGGLMLSLLAKRKGMSDAWKFSLVCISCFILAVPTNQKFIDDKPVQDYLKDPTIESNVTLFYRDRGFALDEYNQYIQEKVYDVYFTPCVKPIIQQILKEEQESYQDSFEVDYGKKTEVLFQPYIHQGIDEGYYYENTYVLRKNKRVLLVTTNRTRTIDDIIEYYMEE